MEQKVVEIEQSNKHSIFTTQFIPKNSNAKSIIISSATGVLQSYYANFAKYFCSLGFTVYTFDYSGIGLSHGKAVKNNTSNLYDWASNQASILSFVKTENPEHKITLITHSIGGQLIAFNKNIKLADFIITVASQSGYWNLFKGLEKPKMFLFWNAVIPIATSLYGYFPARKLKLFENIPKRVAYQWRVWGNRKNYFLYTAKQEDLHLDSITCSIKVLSFPNDAFAPKQTVDWLSKLFTNAKVERLHLEPKVLNVPDIGHFGFFRERFKTSLWLMTKEWIESNT
ncbi:alpha/beta hydrolase [uncultured Lacinutrix sp.]|uniref:alpha/beta hydrolase family protein n=1 Tax=uncultured Lacinutrix sp. TaxID=574032 RepID=UPI0026221BBD|nr:alpha/beta hydrolase [uncultured Lacinutrix sp.]